MRAAAFQRHAGVPAAGELQFDDMRADLNTASTSP
jgi:hypothetical protein